MSDEIAHSVREWLDRAADDWTTVEILTAHERCPREMVCFHCQQYVEKLLKAFLTFLGIEAPRTHDLRRLAQLAAPQCPEILLVADEIDLLTEHAVQLRYPDDWREVELAEMNKLVALAKGIATILIPRLERGQPQ